MPLKSEQKSECAVSSSVPEEVTCQCGALVEIWSDESESTCDDCGKVITRN